MNFRLGESVNLMVTYQSSDPYDECDLEIAGKSVLSLIGIVKKRFVIRENRSLVFKTIS